MRNRNHRRVFKLFILELPLVLRRIARAGLPGTLLTATLGGPLNPTDELASFRFADSELKAELVAAEPNVISPVAVAWDADGRLFVAEMIDYPLGPGTGQIRRLEDSDRDGLYEKATVFADKLSFPNSVLPWNNGLLVTAAPNLWHLKDLDGDGRADERRILLTGFGEGNQQLRVNGLSWGLDNWIYAANGRSDGEARAPGNPSERRASLRNHDLRFRPDTGAFEAIAGRSQFGRARDDWGNQFLSWNTIPVRHVVIEERYLNRNVHLAASEGVLDILAPGDTGRVFPLSPPPLVFNKESSSHFNALAGLTIYRGTALGEEYRGNAFMGESLRNLVHRRVLVPNGVTFVARRGEEGREFLASSDPWFHPVNFATGPDGALYVADFYRQFVEHPEYVHNAAVEKRIPWRTGAEHGRVWRITRKEMSAPDRPEKKRPKLSTRMVPPNRSAGLRPGASQIERKTAPDRRAALRGSWTGRMEVRLEACPTLSDASTAELVNTLGHPNAWWRDTAQRLLVERQDRAAIPILKSEIANHKSSIPLARLHALWTLDGLKALDEETVLRALRDKFPRIREHAVRLSEAFLEKNPCPYEAVKEPKRPWPSARAVIDETLRFKTTPLEKRLAELVNDPDARVRWQLALTAGEANKDMNDRLLVPLARQGMGDRWQALAILSSMRLQPWLFFQLVSQRGPVLVDGKHWLALPNDDTAFFVEKCARMIGGGSNEDHLDDALNRVLWHTSEPVLPGMLVFLAGLADGLEERGQMLRDRLARMGFFTRNPAQRPSGFFTNVLTIANSGRERPRLRAAALRVLAETEPSFAGPTLLNLCLPRQPAAVQAAAVQALVKLSGAELAANPFPHWTEYSPGMRRQLVNAAPRSPALASALLDELEQNKISPIEVDASARQALQKARDLGIRARAQKLLPSAAASNREEAVRAFQSALGLAGNPKRGAGVFAKACIVCHKIQGRGNDVGPDLSGIASRPPEAVLVDILDPSRQVTPDFLSYTAFTNQSEPVTGLIVGETSTAITLRRQNLPDETLSRNQITELRAEGKSLMPDGLEQGWTLQDMADLLAFLGNPDGSLLPKE